MPFKEDLFEPERYELNEGPIHHFRLDRREFVGTIGAGLLISASGSIAQGQREAEDLGIPAAARLHIAENGTITILTGKVEVGQGSRTQISQAAAEELRVPLGKVRVLLADTSITPNDGSTAGSRTTPSTVPVVRRAAASAREMLIRFASELWDVPADSLSVRDGDVSDPGNRRALGYADLARSKRLTAASDESVPRGVSLSRVEDWKVLGEPVPCIRGRDIVTGSHRYPSDILQPGTLYGAVLRPPSYGARLLEVDLAPAQRLGAVAVTDGDFVGCAASTSHMARQAVEALSKAARWKTAPHPSSDKLFDYLRERAVTEGEGRRGPRRSEKGSLEEGFRQAKQTVSATYRIPYIQHAPMEPRAAAAEWKGGHLTVWTGTQRPFGVRQQLMEAFHLREDQVRVIVPDTGGGFGGKHTGEAAIEAARLAKEADRPVLLCWTREEEFAWAYFRPAGLFDLRAGITGTAVIAWDFTNYNAGAAAIESPYNTPHTRTQYFPSESPLRTGSYRGIAATGNNFAREAFMDELAGAAGVDPLAFRLANLDDQRFRAVLEAAAERFGWNEAKSRSASGVGVGIAGGFEKGSYIAACAEVQVDRSAGAVKVLRFVAAFECGAIQNPLNLQAQVEGCIIQGLGGALTEEVRFEKGRLLNGSFAQYPVPRFADVPPIETVLLNRADIPSAGAGETPIIAVAPAIANAVHDAVGVRVRSLPIGGSSLRRV